MKGPQRLVDEQLPSGLGDALRAAPTTPSRTEMVQLTRQIGQALGVSLPPPPPPLRAVEAGASSGASAGSSAAGGVVAGGVGKSGAIVGWVLSGVALGVGLSGGVAWMSGSPDSPTPAEVVGIRSSSSVPVQPAAPVVAQPDRRAEPALPGKDGSASASAGISSSNVAQNTDRLDTRVTTPETELTLLREARARLSGSPAGALELCERHQRRFPAGVLVQEREIIAVDALVRLGRNADAKARAERFQRMHPGSVHAARLASLIGERDDE